MITLVSGFGRCGSSMVMQMLVAGGMDPGEKAKHPYWEDGRQTARGDTGWWVGEYEGRVLKWLDPHDFPLIPGYEYRVIWLDRNVKEQAKSHVKYVRRRGHLVGVTANRQNRKRCERLLKSKRHESLRLICEAAKGEVCMLLFERVLEDPLCAALVLRTFVDFPLDVEKMTAAVVRREPKCKKDFLEDEL